MTDHYDLIIIGTGAGGGTLAHRLAPTGKRILLLERGGYLPREPENWDSREVFLKGRYKTHEEVWYDKTGEAFHPGAHYYVGGNTKAYGAILFRLRERDFDAVQHHAGVSPAWPISYADLEPYYEEAERLYLVHGRAGEDPTEAPRAAAFPYPPVSHEPRIQQLHDDLVRAGHHPFHLPVGVDLDESDPENGRCVRCAKFDGYPCLTDGKADAHVRCVRPALQHPNVTLRTHAKVVRLETERQRPLGHRGGGRPPRRARGLQRRRGRRLGRRGQLRGAAAALGRRPPSQWPCQLLRRRRAPLHGAHQLGGDRDLADRQRHQVPEDAGDQRLLLGLGRRGRRLRPPARPHPDARQERRQRAALRRALVRAQAGAGLRGPPRDRLLADHRGPAASRQPGDARPRRRHPPGQDRPQRRAATVACWAS